MKKKLFISIGLFFLLVAGVLIVSAPLLIESKNVQEHILRRINSLYVVDATVQKISLTWLPFPHVEMAHIKVLHKKFSVTSPQAILYPSWKILFGISSLGRLQIIDPVFQLHEISAEDKETTAAAITLPDMELLIKNGTLLLPDQQNAFFAAQQSLLENISATLAIHGRRVNFSWESDASFAKHLVFTGEFGRKSYGIVYGEVDNLDAQKIALQQSSSALTPLDDRSNVAFIIKKSDDGLHIDLQGDIPDFSLSRLATTENFRLGKGDLKLYLGPQNTFSLLINDLDVLEPPLQITGEIARYFPTDNAQANIKIDLQAKDIDLTAVRQKVLNLLGDSPVAKMVCDIVQRAKVNSASYFFDAPVESFEDVTAMTIAVDIADSDIHLADIPLDLKNAKGPILIKDGDLTGKDITTWVGDAKGTNGVFLVGLAHDKYGLQVDVDIDANLEELPGVLRTLIADKDVVHELGMVQGSGRAKGHLHIGDDLRDFNFTVDVGMFQDVELRYDRLSWPLRPESGHLQITDTSVTWENIKAKMALHSIQETSGHASWDDMAVPLAIRSLHVFFDAQTLLEELRQYPVLDEAFTGALDSIQGSVEVEGALTGPFFNPAKYIYSFDTKLKDIAVSIPALPEKVVIEKGQGTIGHQKILISAGSGSLFGHKIQVSGDLSHDDWQSWVGNLQLSGVLAENHLSWLHDKRIVSNLIIPRPPYRVPNMNIRWDDKLFSLTGKLVSADETTSLDVELYDKGEELSAIFRIKSPTDKASLSLQWQDANETFSSAFKGHISRTSLYALLDDSNFTFDTISGDFKVHKKQDKKTSKAVLDFSGALLGRDIHWKWGKDNNLFTIPTVALVAEGPLLRIKELKADFNNESLAATGTFASKPGSGHLELDLTSSPSLTTTNIEKFQDDLDHFLYTTLANKKEQTMFSTYEISGLLNFNLDSLVLPFGTKDKNGDTRHLYRLPFTPLKGTYLFNQWDSSLNLQKSEICGVEVNGKLTWHGPQETSKELSLATSADKPVEFKDFLSCFNFERTIEGPLNISGRIYSDTTLCRRGGLLLTSKKGKIKKFVALAKTLSLINITGLSGAIWTEGFYYNALEVSGNICDNIFTIDKAFIDGDGVDVVATGEINLSTMEYDITLFVVPFATINGLVTKVPLVGRVLGGKEGRIVSVPVKITGPLDDPIVTILSPTAIGEATGKWILETITLPFGWMIPGKSDQREEHLHDQLPVPPDTTTVPGASESPPGQ